MDIPWLLRCERCRRSPGQSKPHGIQVGDGNAHSILVLGADPAPWAGAKGGEWWVFSPKHPPCIGRSSLLKSSPGSSVGSGLRSPKCWRGSHGCTRSGIADALGSRLGPSWLVPPTHPRGTSAGDH